MVVKPKMKGFICTTAHPVGCAANVQNSKDYVEKKGPIPGPKRVLVIGASTGYGLASRLVAAFGCGADTVGVFYERESVKNRTASAGWYNNRALETLARQEGRVAVSINGDAFSDEIKAQTIEAIQQQIPGGQVDLVVYSLASPRRLHPKTGEVLGSVLKPVGEPFVGKSVDVHKREVLPVEIAPASPEEIRQTIAVMGGEDWLFWMQALQKAGVLAPGARTLAYSYLGPSITHAIYKEGTIGLAKEDLEEKARQIDGLLSPLGGKAYVCVNKALVTQASSAIPVVPLYISLLYKIMKQKGTQEDCTAQITRLFQDRLSQNPVPVDQEGRIRIDDWEMDPQVQQEVLDTFAHLTTENLSQLTDMDGYQKEFYNLFGFEVPGVDYEAEVEID